MHHHLTSEKHESLSCPICAKLIVKYHLVRHGPKCFYSNQVASHIYSWVRFDKNYWCLICAEHFNTCAKLVAHYLAHNEHDNNILGMTRFLLSREHKFVIEKQTKFMQHHMPDYRINSRAGTAYPSQVPDELDFMDLVNQPDIYAVSLKRMYPGQQPVQPPYLLNKPTPHMHSVEPFEEHSFRITDAWFVNW